MLLRMLGARFNAFVARSSASDVPFMLLWLHRRLNWLPRQIAADGKLLTHLDVSEDVCPVDEAAQELAVDERNLGSDRQLSSVP